MPLPCRVGADSKSAASEAVAEEGFGWVVSGESGGALGALLPGRVLSRSKSVAGAGLPVSSAEAPVGLCGSAAIFAIVF